MCAVAVRRGATRRTHLRPIMRTGGLVGRHADLPRSFKRVKMPKPTTKAEKKTVFLERLDSYVDGYSKILIIHADNVTSLQMVPSAASNRKQLKCTQ